MLDESALQTMRPLIVTPAYGGMVTAAYTRSMLGVVNESWRFGIHSQIKVTNGSSLITRARNELLIDFLEDRAYTHLVWIDADVGFEPASLWRMLRSDLDVVAGAYPIKGYHWPVHLSQPTTVLQRNEFESRAMAFPVNTHADAGLSGKPDENGFLEVTEAPTGFMAIKRSVFDKLIAYYGDSMRYVPDDNMSAERAKHCYLFFDVMVEPSTRRYLSEDYAFCYRWRAIGGKVFIDTQARLSHSGTHVFQGCFADALQANPNRAVGGN